MKNVLVPFFFPPISVDSVPAIEFGGGADAAIGESVNYGVGFNGGKGVGDKTKGHNNGDEQEFFGKEKNN